MKTILAVLTLSFCVCSFAQTPAAADSTMVLTFGAGASQFSEPHVGITGSFGVRVADGTYTLTSIDAGAKYDAATKQLVQLSTIRTGIQRRLVNAGPLNLFAALDAGLATGAGATVGSFSGGGSVTYDLPKHPELFVYGALRAVKAPGDTTGAVQTAFSVGVGVRIGAAAK
jgi:hypothetical protein